MHDGLRAELLMLTAQVSCHVDNSLYSCPPVPLENYFTTICAILYIARTLLLSKTCAPLCRMKIVFKIRTFIMSTCLTCLMVCCFSLWSLFVWCRFFNRQEATGPTAGKQMLRCVVKCNMVYSWCCA